MKKNKIHPRVFERGLEQNSHSFFYRLLTGQRFLTIIGLTLLIIIIFPLAQTYSQRRLIEKEIQDVQGQINNYEIQNKQLQDLITYLQSDESLEAQARLNLNMKKPGEGVIVVEDKKANIVQAEINSNNKLDNNLTKWWYYFFN